MAIKIERKFNSEELLIRLTADVFIPCALEQYIKEMEKATCEFVKTDPEVRILINEMVRVAFQQVDLLKLITETIKQSLPAKIEPKE